MHSYTTANISSAIQWLDRCQQLGETSRTNLVKVLSSARFEAVLRQRDGSKIVIEYEHDETCHCLPRRVLLEVAGHRPSVAIVCDRGAWILCFTGPPAL